jgi:hypothetical protein
MKMLAYLYELVTGKKAGDKQSRDEAMQVIHRMLERYTNVATSVWQGMSIDAVASIGLTMVSIFIIFKNFSFIRGRPSTPQPIPAGASQKKDGSAPCMDYYYSLFGRRPRGADSDSTEGSEPSGKWTQQSYVNTYASLMKRR